MHSCTLNLPVVLQIATKAGVLNVPEWYDAGAYWIQNNPGTPFGENHCPHVLHCIPAPQRVFAPCTAVIFKRIPNDQYAIACPHALRTTGPLHEPTTILLRVCAASLLFIQIVLSAWVEGKRWADFQNPGSQGDGSFFGITDDFVPTSNGYPGGKLFDPFGLSRGSAGQLERYKVLCCFLSYDQPLQSCLVLLSHCGAGLLVQISSWLTIHEPHLPLSYSLS